MIELHLIGYTEDGEHLVLDLDADGDGRYLLAIDPDLLATAEAVRNERLAAGKPVDERGDPAPPAPADPRPAAARRAPSEPFAPPRGAAGNNGGGPRDPAPAGSEPSPSAAAPAHGAGAAARAQPDGSPTAPAGEPVEATPAPAAPVEPPDVVSVRSRLSPAEIQARLRAGRSVRAVAREADVDRAWVERWNEPIRAERERVLADARTRRVDLPRARPLGAAVDRSLTERGVDPATAAWRVVRRADGRWRVSVRFGERGRPRTATWLLDPDAERLRAQSRLATELSAPGRGKSAR